MENSRLEECLVQLKKELVITRIFCIISSVLTLVLIIGGIYFYAQIKPVLEIAEKTVNIIEELSSFDVDGVNVTLEKVGKTIDSVNWEDISNAVERLNGVIDVLEDWGEKLGSFKNLFG